MSETDSKVPEAAAEMQLPVFKFDVEQPDEIGNLAEKFNVDERLHAGERLMELIAIDEGSCKDWITAGQRYLKKVTENAAPYDDVKQEEDSGEDSAVNPSLGIIVSAVVQFNGRATDAILGDPDIVKSSADDDISRGMATWLSDQLRVGDPEWTPDTDLIALHASITGLAWRKRWPDRRTKKFKSSFLPFDAVIINSAAPSVARAPRVTHILKYYPHEIAPLIASGDFCEFDMEEDSTDPQALSDFRECHCWLDMDGDSAEEPWVATIYTEKKILVALTPRWDKFNAFKKTKKGKDGESYVVIKPRNHFTPYRFIPNPSGAFHSLGYGWLLEKYEDQTGQLMNSAIGITKKVAADGGIMYGVPGGLPETIELKRDRMNVLQGDGRSLNDNMVMFASKEVPASVPKLIEMLVQTADKLTGSTALVEGLPGNTTAAMASGVLQNNAQVHSAIHRRMLTSMTAEVRDFAALAVSYEVLPDTLKEGMKGADLTKLGLTADPMMATENHRQAMVAYYARLIEDPLTDPKELRLRMHRLMRVPDPEKLMRAPPPPQLSPVEQAKLAADMFKHQTGRMEVTAGATADYASAFANIVNAAAQIQEFLATIQPMAQTVEATDNGGQQQQPGAANGPGAPGGMATPPPNGGIPPTPQPQTAGLGSALVGGLGPGDGSAPGPSGGAGGSPAPTK